MNRPVVVDHPVPWHRPRGQPARGILVHSMGEHITLGSGQELPAADFLRQSKELTGHKYSAHKLVSPGGTLVRCVARQEVAYHAGMSQWNGWELARHGSSIPSLNDRFLGIEVLASGAWDYAAFRQACRAGLIEYTEEQYNAAGWQVARWQAVEDILDVDVTGHMDAAGDSVRGAGKGKVDPGAGWDWDKLWAVVRDWRTHWQEELGYDQ